MFSGEPVTSNASVQEVFLSLDAPSLRSGAVPSKILTATQRGQRNDASGELRAKGRTSG